jgi:hypothetical protein
MLESFENGEAQVPWLAEKKIKALLSNVLKEVLIFDTGVSHLFPHSLISTFNRVKKY